MRTLLREFEFGTTYAAGERLHSRGVATAPGTRRSRGRVPSSARALGTDESSGRRAGVGMTAREQVVDVGRGIELCYDQIGDPGDPPIVLIAGLGQQLHSWPTDFAAALAGTGLSRDPVRQPRRRPVDPHGAFRRRSRWRSCGEAAIRASTTSATWRGTPSGCSTRSAISDAHLVGISMGGMIAQTVAAHYPGRVRTLTSIMSTTGAPRIGRPALSTWRRMATARPPRTRAEAMDRARGHFPPHRFSRFPVRRGAGARARGHRAGTAIPTRAASAASWQASSPPVTARPSSAPDRRADAGDPRRPRPDGPSDRGCRNRAGDPRCAAGDDRRHGPRPAHRRVGPRSST